MTSGESIEPLDVDDVNLPWVCFSDLDLEKKTYSIQETFFC